MKKRALTILILILTLAAGPAALAQQAPRPPRPSTPPRQTPSPAPRPRVEVEVHAQEHGQVVAEVNQKLARGTRVLVSNRFGDVIVEGVDGDTLQARATGDEGAASLYLSEADSRVSFGVSSRPRPTGEAVLRVRLPRFADVEIINSRGGDIRVSNLEGSVAIGAGRGDVFVTRVGALRISREGGDATIREVNGNCQVRVTGGDVNVDTVRGLIDVATASGELILRNIDGDVRAASASGGVNVQCAKGRAEVSSASGSIILAAIDGDVQASTVSGEVIFRGSIKPNGRYSLKSVSGEVAMMIQADAPGFTATLSSYSGEIETDFPLKLDTQLKTGGTNRKVIGRYGDGQAILTLDSFSGGARVVKRTQAQQPACK